MTTIFEALAIATEHQRCGRLRAAEQICRQVLQADPNQAEALHLLGLIAYQVGKPESAVPLVARAIAANGNESAFHNSLGLVYQALERAPEAVACFRRAVELKPDAAQVHFNLGNVLMEQRLLDEAIACYRRALELKRDFPEAHNNLGNAFKDQEKFDEAAACYRRALQWAPESPQVENNLANVLMEQGKLDEAAGSFRRALELKPDNPNAHNNLGNVLKDQGKLDEAVACYRQALQRKPDFALAHSNLLMTLHYRPGVSLATLAEAHAEYESRHAAPLRATAAPHENRSDRPARLRLGLVSADLRRHPVGYFAVRVLENLSDEHFETICYSDQNVNDDLTVRIHDATTQWRVTGGMSDEQLAERIRADRIDILFDLAGHTGKNRLLVFARKPAPVQITWAGYVGTTGLSAMDYLLADRYHVPPDAERFCQERVLRMPDGYVCYDPPAYAPPVTPLPAIDGGQVTLGCFNNPTKITPQVIETWAKILRRLPGARLVLKSKVLSDSGLARRFAETFATHAIDPGRLEFLGHSPHAELLAEYGRIDLALDPFPYSGGLTSCEALWMGVPVMTCPFETFASRHSLSHLSTVGLTETIARGLDEYVDLAVSLAGDLPRLAELRASLRDRMAASPLCDGKRFAANLTRVLGELSRDSSR